MLQIIFLLFGISFIIYMIIVAKQFHENQQIIFPKLKIVSNNNIESITKLKAKKILWKNNKKYNRMQKRY
jgi:hypothetical protein